MGEASKAKAKKDSEAKKSKVGSVLRKRVEITPSNSKKLAKDVKAPKWLRAIGGYFVGSYKELRQVKWPTRRSAWGLTFAVIAFTLVLVILILALDYGFEQLFKKVIL